MSVWSGIDSLWSLSLGRGSHNTPIPALSLEIWILKIHPAPRSVKNRNILTPSTPSFRVELRFLLPRCGSLVRESATAYWCTIAENRPRPIMGSDRAFPLHFSHHSCLPLDMVVSFSFEFDPCRFTSYSFLPLLHRYHIMKLYSAFAFLLSLLFPAITCFELSTRFFALSASSWGFRKTL